ncbi:MAG: LPS export ABC transporter permease LptF [Betaproteobacteria bacterium RIFCSPLOWO2_12_FULL_68_19]|nr:MAG: LPS export ABC transporter permease LptF [Betaproteobacteria bacterium RIFCSPLOWO2_12_FULL_68_19]
MIFHRALLREFAGLAGAVFMTLFSIALTTRLIRLLGQAAGGKIPTDAVIAFLGFFALHALPVLLSLTMFISVLLTLTRGWRDSEMVIWFGSGLPLTAWLKPVLLFALPQIAVIAALSLFISPWAAQMAAQYSTRVDARDDLSRVSPGVFGETPGKDRVFFVESVSGETQTVQNVFVSSVHQTRTGVSMSRSGHTETAANGDRFIVLEQGRRYEGAPGDEQYRITEFDRYAARIETKEGREPAVTHKSLTTLALIGNPTPVNLGELLWRIGVPVSALVLVLLAIPMSFVNPRAGRSMNLLFALFTFIVYSNLLSVSQARVALGRLDFGLGWWLVHAAMVLLLVVMFAQRMQLIRLRLGS